MKIDPNWNIYIQMGLQGPFILPNGTRRCKNVPNVSKCT